MAEANQYVFDYSEVVEALIKKQGLHEGVWGIYLEFGLQASNMMGPEGQPFPVAVIPVVKVGIQRAKDGVKIAGMLDAATVNPVSSQKSQPGAKAKSS